MQHQVNLRGAKKHHDTIRDMMATSSRVFSSISGVPKWVYGSRILIVSARTNKRHHHHHHAPLSAAAAASAAARKRAEAAARAPARTGCTVTGRMLPAAPAGTCRSAALAAPSLADQAPYSQPVELDQGSTPLAFY